MESQPYVLGKEEKKIWKKTKLTMAAGLMEIKDKECGVLRFQALKAKVGGGGLRFQSRQHE